VYFDATFKVVPTIYYQLFTVFVPFADAAFPVVFTIMSRKKQALYTKVFDKICNLVPQFAPTCAMVDFEEASVSTFQEVFGNIIVSGCWFHYAQALMKRVNKEGLKEDYTREQDVGSIVHCLMSLPLLPPREIADALSDIQVQLAGAVLESVLADMNKNPRSRLHPLCPTRWTVRARALNSVLKNYKTVMDSLDELSDENGQTGAKAGGLLDKMRTFECLMGLTICHEVFSIIEQLATALQRTDDVKWFQKKCNDRYVYTERNAISGLFSK